MTLGKVSPVSTGCHRQSILSAPFGLLCHRGCTGSSGTVGSVLISWLIHQAHDSIRPAAEGGGETDTRGVSPNPFLY